MLGTIDEKGVAPDTVTTRPTRHCFVGEAFDQLETITICTFHESALRQGPGVVMHLPREGACTTCRSSRGAPELLQYGFMLVWMCVVGPWVVSGSRVRIPYAHIKRNHLGRPCRLQKEHGRMTRHESQLTNCYHGPTSSNIPTQPSMQEPCLCLLQSGREDAPLPVHAVTHTQALGHLC